MKSKVHPRYKTKYRVANWAAYNQALVRRGDVTVWVSSNAIAAWDARPEWPAGRAAALLGSRHRDRPDPAAPLPSPAAPSRRIPARPVRDDAPRPLPPPTIRRCASRIPNSLAESRIEAPLRGAWRLAYDNRGAQPRVVEGPHAVDLRRRTHGGPCRAEQCQSGLPLPGLGPAPSGGLTTNSRRTGGEQAVMRCGPWTVCVSNSQFSR